MNKQIGPMLLGAELAVRTYRYESAIESADLVTAVRAGVEVVNVLRLRAKQISEGAPERLEATAFVVANPQELLRDDRSRDAMQSVFVDLISWRAIKNCVDPDFLHALHDAATSACGRHDAIDAIVAAAMDPKRIQPGSTHFVLLAGGVGIGAQDIESDPAIRFRRDVMAVAHQRSSIARDVLGDAVARWVIDGWRWVAEHQRFMLRDPMRTVPPIEVITLDSTKRSLSDAAKLLLAARDALHHSFPAGWFELLEGLASR